MLNAEKNRRDILHKYAASFIWADEEDIDVLNTLFQETGAPSNPETLSQVASALGVGGARVNLEYIQELLTVTDPFWAVSILVDHIPKEKFVDTYKALRKFT